MSQPNSKNIRILLVDDFELVRNMLKSALIAYGYTDVEDADNGSIALDMIAQADNSGQPYGIVFCDWNMPEVTGLEVLEVLRRTPKFEKLPFVMVTAESEQHMVAKAMRAGATDYIIKPIDAGALSAKLERIVDALKRAA